MHKKTKTVLLTLCAVVLAVGCVLGTLAYLSDRDSVANTFTVGDVQIRLDEAVVDPDGKPVTDEQTGEGLRTEEGNEYHLIPGMTYTKDPTVTVEKGSVESYVRMMVTVNCLEELKAIFGDDFLPEEYVTGWDRELWACAGITEGEDNTVTYEFRYHTTVDAFEAEEDIVLEPLFTAFTLPGEVTGAQLATIQDLTISVEGHAIQAATFENADEAWAAFDAQVNP